jgi:glycosyltransferase involved in cell wall biosynthesis
MQAVRRPEDTQVLMLLANNRYPHDTRAPKEAIALVDAGYRVSVVSPGEPGHPRRETIDGVDVYRYHLPGRARGTGGYIFEYLYSALASLAVSVRVLRSQGFDIVHLHNPPDTLGLVAAVFKLLGKRVVFDHHDLAPEMYRARFGRRARRSVFWALIATERLCCKVADVVLATNDSYKRVDIERNGVAPDRIIVVRNGPGPIVLEPYIPDASLREGAESVVGYVGVIGYQDGLDYLLRAIRHLVHDHARTRLRCLIIGTGDALADLKTLARDLEIDSNIWFVGEKRGSEVFRHLAAADVCVVPDPSNEYTDRSTMVKIMEYMALSKPIVAFDLPENRVSAGDSALYVVPNDERAFAQAIADLIDDPSKRKRMGDIGRERVEESLMWSFSIPPLLAAYERLAIR